MTRFLTLTLFITLCVTALAQPTRKVTMQSAQLKMAQPYRQSLTDSTRLVLTTLDTLLMPDSTLEFRIVGEGGRQSKKFQTYAHLAKVATEKELLIILDAATEHPAIRGYAYMAYAYKCTKQKKAEVALNYNFSIKSLNGCIVFTLGFKEFKNECKKRDANNPNPRTFTANPQEKKATKSENKTRTEQNLPQRK